MFFYNVVNVCLVFFVVVIVVVENDYWYYFGIDVMGMMVGYGYIYLGM